MEIAGKWAHVPPFTVTPGQRNRHGSVGYLRLPIIDLHPWAYLMYTVFKIKGDFIRK